MSLDFLFASLIQTAFRTISPKLAVLTSAATSVFCLFLLGSSAVHQKVIVPMSNWRIFFSFFSYPQITSFAFNSSKIFKISSLYIPKWNNLNRWTLTPRNFWEMNFPELRHTMKWYSFYHHKHRCLSLEFCVGQAGVDSLRKLIKVEGSHVISPTGT